MEDLPTFFSAAFVGLYSDSWTFSGMKQMKDNMESDELLACEVFIKVHLVGRDDPIMAPMGINFREGELPQDVEELTDYVNGLLMERLDSKSSHLLVIEDLNHTKVIFISNNIDSITIVAPEDGVLPPQLREGNENNND